MENFASAFIGRFWPGRAKENARLLAEKRPFTELRDGKFRQHPQWPQFLADCDNSPFPEADIHYGWMRIGTGRWFVVEYAK